MQGIAGLVEQPVPFQVGFQSMESDTESSCYPEFFPPKNEELKEKLQD